MTTQMLGMLVGGVIPAVCFGVSAVFAKASTQKGISLGPYLLAIALAVFCGAGLFAYFSPGAEWNKRSASYAFMSGGTWVIGAGLLAYSLNTYNVPISKLVPLYNTNTLVAVLISLWLFAEWQDLSVFKLITGSVLVVIGAVLVSNA